ncbi:hypothetical protein FB451DRAFT_1362788 [Mycena latifolia]|nr:hypothetical protein FB451DRAFT_1362788 [Mycena latifolia]
MSRWPGRRLPTGPYSMLKIVGQANGAEPAPLDYVALLPAAPTRLTLKGPVSLPFNASSLLSQSLASFSIVTAFFIEYLGNMTDPNTLMMNLLQNLKDRTGTPAEIRIGGVTADSTYWNASLYTALFNFIDNSGTLFNTTIGYKFWEAAASRLPDDTKITMNLARSAFSRNFDLHDFSFTGALSVAESVMAGLNPEQLAAFETRGRGNGLEFFYPAAWIEIQPQHFLTYSIVALSVRAKKWIYCTRAQLRAAPGYHFYLTADCQRISSTMSEAVEAGMSPARGVPPQNTVFRAARQRAGADYPVPLTPLTTATTSHQGQTEDNMSRPSARMALGRFTNDPVAFPFDRRPPSTATIGASAVRQASALGTVFRAAAQMELGQISVDPMRNGRGSRAQYYLNRHPLIAAPYLRRPNLNIGIRATLPFASRWIPHVKISPWRVLNTFVVLALGTVKATTAYLGQSAAPTTLDWTIGVVWTLLSYWISLVEQEDPALSTTWFFAKDLSGVLGVVLLGCLGTLLWIIWFTVEHRPLAYRHFHDLDAVYVKNTVLDFKLVVMVFALTSTIFASLSSSALPAEHRSQFGTSVKFISTPVGSPKRGAWVLNLTRLAIVVGLLLPYWVLNESRQRD